MHSNILSFILSNKWMMYRPALHTMIDIISKVADDPIAIAKAFHGTNYERFLTEDNQPKFHSILGNINMPKLEGSYKVLVDGNVAVVPVTGGIFPRSSAVPMSSGSNTPVDKLSHDFQLLEQTVGIDTIIQVIDSPGGEVTGVSEAATIINNVSKKKKVISFVYGMAASAGYWLASAAPTIIGSNTSEVGSIGVVASFTDTSEFDAKRGIKRHEIVSNLSPNKRPDLTTAEGQDNIRKVIDDLAFVFVDSVASYRGVSFETVLKSFGGGNMFVAKDAVGRGMIDKISTLQEVINENKPKLAVPGGTFMNVTEFQASNPELYKQITGDAAKKALDDDQKVKAAEQEAKVKAKAEDDRIEALVTAKMKAMQEEALKKNAQEFQASQQTLAAAVADVGTSDQTANTETDAQLASIVTVAAKQMNDSRKY